MGPEMRIREYLIAVAVEVFKDFGYEPVDSPVMELWETISAKGGDEIEAETFKFKDKGDREVGLIFDLTIPLARISASNPHLPKPFKRYAIGKAGRKYFDKYKNAMPLSRYIREIEAWQTKNNPKKVVKGLDNTMPFVHIIRHDIEHS